jgi:uncharacterized protein CbrC (UPF0167 family)
MALSNKLPAFKYHPDPIKTKAFETDKTVICDCCEKETNIYYSLPCYSCTDIDFLCPECIKDGKANKKFDCEFQDRDNCDSVRDEEKLNELCYRTPGFCASQDPYWLAHCDDYCAFVDYVDWSDIKRMNIEAEIKEDIAANSGLLGYSLAEIKEYLENKTLQGYLFRCLVCGKSRLYVDCD